MLRGICAYSLVGCENFMGQAFWNFWLHNCFLEKCGCNDHNYYLQLVILLHGPSWIVYLSLFNCSSKSFNIIYLISEIFIGFN